MIRTKKTPLPVDMGPDIVKLQSIAMRMLDRLDTAVQDNLENDKVQMELQIKRYEFWFGARSSLTSTLTALTDLILKLNGLQGAAGHTAAPAISDALSEQDYILIRHFMENAASV